MQLLQEFALIIKITQDFIGNERRRRKHKCASSENPPSKLRCPSGYNLFVGEFFKSEG